MIRINISTHFTSLTCKNSSYNSFQRNCVTVINSHNFNSFQNIVSNKIGTGLQLENRKASLLCGFCAVKPLFGRSGEAQTRGLRIPNAARYQLRYTPIVIKLWSCKWSNLWSNTFLTAIFCFPNRPKSARLKGFRRFSLSCGANTVYAPKAGALPVGRHLGLNYYI